jgi:hypothetical protein
MFGARFVYRSSLLPFEQVSRSHLFGDVLTVAAGLKLARCDAPTPTAFRFVSPLFKACIEST